MTEAVLRRSAVRVERQRRTRRFRSGPLITYALIVLCIVVLLFPVVWMVSTAFKTSEQAFHVPPVWWPGHPTVKPFAYAISPIMLRFFTNSIIIAGLSAVAATLIGAATAYAISRGRHWSLEMLLAFMLGSMAFPLPLLMISMYAMLTWLGLLNSYGAVVIGDTILTLPIVIWLLKGFIDGLPAEVEESAYVEGAGPIRIIWSIVLPMLRPGFTAAGIYVFVTSWNEFVLGLTFTTSTDMRPLPAGISLAFLQEFQYQWPEMMAVATVATLPILLLFVALQRNFVEGVTAGAVKH